VYAGRETLVECRTTDWEELRGATMALQGGPLRNASVRYTVEPAGANTGAEQTVVTYTAEGELTSALILLRPLMPAMRRAGATRNLKNLKRRLETPDKRTSQGKAKLTIASDEVHYSREDRTDGVALFFVGHRF
jgi:hypothetical protein